MAFLMLAAVLLPGFMAGLSIRQWVHLRRQAGTSYPHVAQQYLWIGVNANQTREQLPAEAQTEPTSLRLELGEPVNRVQLLIALLLRLERAYDAWVATGTSASG